MSTLKMSLCVEGLNVRVSTLGAWDSGASRVSVQNVVFHPAQECLGSPASACRTLAAQIYAKASNDLRRSFIHAVEGALNQVIERASVRGATKPLGVIISHLDSGEVEVLISEVSP